ncbi:MAG: T9SS type A sorting domain-containing protein [Bacteroidetes bacterium]|nr:T9SS type A sorting domain-containing protein [Bacteroidota bacterium]
MKTVKQTISSLTVIFFTLSFFIITVFSTSIVKADGFNGLSYSGSMLFVVGDNGAVFRSGDGGLSFTNRSVGATNYNSVAANGLNVWVGGNNGTLLKSTNLGIAFTSSTVAAENIKSLFFIDASTGWAACTAGKIYKTTNGGVNWTAQTTPVTNDFNSLKFLNSNKGIVCGNNKTLLTTTNGGTSWIASAIPINKNILAADFVGDTIYASCNDGYVIKSINFGSSWSVIDYKVTTKPDITGIAVTANNEFFSTGTGGFIRKSTDGGATFTYLNNPAWVDLSIIYFYNNLQGWAISKNSNMILRTVNGGINWLMPSGTSQSLSWQLKIPLTFYTSSGNVFYQSTWNKKEIFVTNSNRIYRSLDAGETWTAIGNPIPRGTISNSFCVSSKDTNIFMVAIDSSSDVEAWVYRSTDYGNTWNVSISGNRSSDGTPFGQDYNHPDTVYYGLQDTNIFRTTNFGISWTPVGNYKFSNVCYVRVLESNPNIILVGGRNWNPPEYATIVRSSDYGQTWNVVDSNGGDHPELPVIATSSLSTTLYAGRYEGEDGGVMRSTNLGATWGHINLDEYVWGMDIAKDDPNVLCYANWGGGIGNWGNVSYDRGVHFTLLPELAGVGNFAVYFYNRKTLFLQQPLGFYKLRATVTVPIGIQNISTTVPEHFAMSQNFPNPFNPTTKIKFDIASRTAVRISVFDGAGREVYVLANEGMNPGTYTVDWNAENFPSGVYYCKMQTDNFIETKKMVLVK